jgi:hypothetical protein
MKFISNEALEIQHFVKNVFGRRKNKKKLYDTFAKQFGTFVGVGNQKKNINCT